VLLLDNARIHHSEEIAELVKGYGCRIEYLPPYSPDYQPIEQAFSVIKSHLKRNGIGFFTDRSCYYELYEAATIITPDMTWGFFGHCGYV
jgi:DDE superfamily endonuclease